MRVTVVIATRNRPAELSRTLAELAALSPPPPVIVVDNASDGGVGWLRRHPTAPRVLALSRNRGCAARTVGARHARTPYVAFCDDDSWWARDSLPRAVAAFDHYPRLGLLAGRVLVGPQQAVDPVTVAMAASPLADRDALPGRPVLGCLACAAVVRRKAYLGVGGFREMFLIGGEEALLCYDLAAAGWGVRYVADVVAHHHPSTRRAGGGRRQAVERRNAALTRWMRRPLGTAAADSWRLVRDIRDPVARAALGGLLTRLPVALAQRRRLPPHVEHDIRLLEGGDRFTRTSGVPGRRPTRAAPPPSRRRPH